MLRIHSKKSNQEPPPNPKPESKLLEWVRFVQGGATCNKKFHRVKYINSTCCPRRPLGPAKEHVGVRRGGGPLARESVRIVREGGISRLVHPPPLNWKLAPAKMTCPGQRLKRQIQAVKNRQLANLPSGTNKGNPGGPRCLVRALKKVTEGQRSPTT